MPLPDERIFTPAEADLANASSLSSSASRAVSSAASSEGACLPARETVSISDKAARLLVEALATEVRASRDALRAASAPGVDPLVLARAQGAHDALASLADTVCCPSCGAPIGAEYPCDDCP